jgi:pantoate--beta-alanine ligase
MEVIHTIAWMKQVAREARRSERILGFVPTMGALHEGHLSLVREAKKLCSPIVASIFVNPTQFGPTEDFQKYPRAFETDRVALENLGVDYLFAPKPEDIYPRDFRTAVFVEGLSDKLEGKARPGHFRGVTTVVAKLFEIVQPSFAYFGRKDAQQVRIIQQMARDLNMDAEVMVCPILREPDGLAMSSRNAYLSVRDRNAATVIYGALDAVRQRICAGERDAVSLLVALRQTMDMEKNLQLDYAEIVDAETFESVPSLRKNCYVLVAARAGTTRLIDNAYIEQDGEGFRVTV